MGKTPIWQDDALIIGGITTVVFTTYGIYTTPKSPLGSNMGITIQSILAHIIVTFMN